MQYMNLPDGMATTYKRYELKHEKLYSVQKHLIETKGNLKHKVVSRVSIASLCRPNTKEIPSNALFVLFLRFFQDEISLAKSKDLT
jgi:hypothetical protein